MRTARTTPKKSSRKKAIDKKATKPAARARITQEQADRLVELSNDLLELTTCIYRGWPTCKLAEKLPEKIAKRAVSV